MESEGYDLSLIEEEQPRNLDPSDEAPRGRSEWCPTRYPSPSSRRGGR